MTVRMTVDDVGVPTGFWPDTVYADDDPRIPADSITIDDGQYLELVEASGSKVWSGEDVIDYVAPTAVLTEREYSYAIQARLDSKAQERQYDSMQTAISYRGDANINFAKEADALFYWRSSVWTYALAELEKINSGLREIPSLDGFIEELPEFIWP